MLMLQSLSYLAFFILAGTAIFVFLLPHLTSLEKARAFVIACTAGPVAALFFNGVFFTWHDSVFQQAALQGQMRGDDAALHLLSAFVGVLVSGAVLWGARHLNDSRSYADFVGMQQRLALAKEQARIAAEQRQERLLQGQVQLATLQLQERLVAVHQSETYARAIETGAALEKQVQKLRLAYASYCSTIDPLNEQDQATLIDGFRGELRRPRFLRGRIDIDLLNQSDDPLVRQILHGRPTISLTPDEWVTP